MRRPWQVGARAAVEDEEDGIRGVPERTNVDRALVTGDRQVDLGERGILIRRRRDDGPWIVEVLLAPRRQREKEDCGVQEMACHGASSRSDATSARI